MLLISSIFFSILYKLLKPASKQFLNLENPFSSKIKNFLTMEDRVVLNWG